MVERLAEQVVEHTEVQLARRYDRVDLAVSHQPSHAAVVAQVDEQLCLGDLCRDVQVGRCSEDGSVFHRDGPVVLACLRLLQLPVFEGLPVFLFGTSRFHLDQVRIVVGQVTHIVDAPLPVGGRGDFDREDVGVDALAVIDARHLRKAGAQYCASPQESHVALAALRVEGDGFADQGREQLV